MTKPPSENNENDDEETLKNRKKANAKYGKLPVYLKIFRDEKKLFIL